MSRKNFLLDSYNNKSNNNNAMILIIIYDEIMNERNVCVNEEQNYRNKK